MKRTATANWSGELKEGSGTLKTQSAVLNGAPYTYKTRFETEIGTNPEELLAAAHAGCFTMAVSAAIGKKGYTPDTLATTCTITMEGLKITGSHLALTGVVHGMIPDEFEEVAKETAKNCVISKALNIPITYEVHFNG